MSNVAVVLVLPGSSQLKVTVAAAGIATSIVAFAARIDLIAQSLTNGPSDRAGSFKARSVQNNGSVKATKGKACLGSCT
jgi:hypothetical protein